MAATALIKLTQGPNTDLPGVAVLGTLVDGAVVVTNGDNTDVASWEIHLTEVPPGSLITPGLLASGVSATPVGAFVPDKDGGCYRILLVVRDGLSNEDKDIRCFGILERRGFLIPPPQLDPPPIKTKPNELNFQGQPKGWAGDRFFPFTNAILRSVLDSQYDSPVLPNPAARIEGDKLVFRAGGSGAFFNPGPITGAPGFLYVMNVGQIGMSEVNMTLSAASRLIETMTSPTDALSTGIYDPINGTLIVFHLAGFSTPEVHVRDLNGFILSGALLPTAGTPGPNLALSPTDVFVTYPFFDLSANPALSKIDRNSATIIVDGPVYGGVGASFVTDIVYDSVNDKIWFSSAGNNYVLRIDPATLNLEVTVTDLNLQNPQAMVIAAGFLWVTNLSALNVMRISIPGGTVFDFLTNPAIQQPTDISYDPVRNKIWVLDTFFNTLVRIDAATNTYETSFTLPGAPADNRTIEYIDGYIWVSDVVSSALHQVDPTSGSVVNSIISNSAGFVYDRSNHTRDMGVTPPFQQITNQDGVIFVQGNGNVFLPQNPSYDGQTHTIFFNPLVPPPLGYEGHVIASQGIIGDFIMANINQVLTFRWAVAVNQWIST